MAKIVTLSAPKRIL